MNIDNVNINGLDIHIKEDEGYITEVGFGKVMTCGKITEEIKKCERELREYFCGMRKKFTVNINAKGTDFQKKVWNALLNIPYGETKSYGEIAHIINCPKGARAVGNANNKNPVAIIIPCHRVIGSKGDIVGYGAGKKIRKMLLELESSNIL